LIGLQRIRPFDALNHIDWDRHRTVARSNVDERAPARSRIDLPGLHDGDRAIANARRTGEKRNWLFNADRADFQRLRRATAHKLDHRPEAKPSNRPTPHNELR
jgi:hypothetical protein